MTSFNSNATPLVDIDKDSLKALIESFTPEKLSSFIDVTDLKADTDEKKIRQLAEWAKQYGCASVCVNPVELDIMPLLLKGSNVKNCYVIDFPLGKLDIELKAQQTAYVVAKNRALRGEGKGQIELDMVINVGRFRKDSRYTLEEINAVCEAADGELVKVIVRSSELTGEEVAKVSEIVAESKAHFIKNSTGMDAYGALPEHMRIMREVVGNEKGVKASGGVADALTAMRLMWVAAGETSLQTPERFRFGTSNPLNIINTMKSLIAQADEILSKDNIPCAICPYSHTEKMSPDLIAYSKQRCLNCQYIHFRNF